jgi:glycosyltransferase involved in cell wall biosynthesis
VFVPGFVRDVSPYFRAARIFVAPIRYGAGVNGKIGQALTYRLPVVTTPVGAEGFGLTDGTNSLIAEDTEAFAAAIVRLYEDAGLRARLAASAERTLQPFSSEHAVAAALEILDRVAPRRPPRNPDAYRPETL